MVTVLPARCLVSRITRSGCSPLGNVSISSSGIDGIAAGFVLYTKGELFLLFLLITKELKNLIAIKRISYIGQNKIIIKFNCLNNYKIDSIN